MLGLQRVKERLRPVCSPDEAGINNPPPPLGRRAAASCDDYRSQMSKRGPGKFTEAQIAQVSCHCYLNKAHGRGGGGGWSEVSVPVCEGKQWITGG